MSATTPFAEKLQTVTNAYEAARRHVIAQALGADVVQAALFDEMTAGIFDPVDDDTATLEDILADAVPIETEVYMNAVEETDRVTAEILGEVDGFRLSSVDAGGITIVQSFGDLGGKDGQSTVIAAACDPTYPDGVHIRKVRTLGSDELEVPVEMTDLQILDEVLEGLSSVQPVTA